MPASTSRSAWALKARKLYDARRKLVAAASYLAARQDPRSPQDLTDWDWLELLPVRLKPAFRRAGHKTVQLKPAPRLSVNDAHAIYRLARAGAGLAIVPEFLSEEDESSGTMTHVLPEWQLDPIGVYAVWPPNAPKEGLTAHFVDALLGAESPG